MGRHRGSWHAWTDTEWRDEVAPPGEELGRLDQDFESFMEDMGEMVRTVVECTVEPLRTFAGGMSRTMEFELKHWRHGWERPWGRHWRHARRWR